MRYKALMLDLDGTTVSYNYDAMPSSRVTDAINKAKKLLHVGIATGRTTLESKMIFDNLKLRGPSIVSGGAQVIDAETKKVIWEARLDEKSIKEINKVFKKYKKQAFINDEETGERIPINSSRHRKSALTIWNSSVESDIADKIVSDLSNIPTVAPHKIKSWEKDMFAIQVGSLNATKQYGIFEITKILGIDTCEIIGVGDSYNDFPLLLACGLKVAVGNAAPELKEIADFVAPSVDNDGVAVVIEKFILEPNSNK